ncbi:DedA family protein [Afipia sp. TerB]
MGPHLTELVDLVAAHALLAYLAVAVAAFLEAVPIAGALVPGSTVILALSALIPSGHLHLAPVLGAAMTGALVGDGLAFWIGYRAQRRILEIWPLSNYPALIAESEAFFHRHGTWAVFFARFVPPIRAVAPITAGALGMPPVRFAAAMTAAVAVWAPAMVLPGVLAGSALERWGLEVKHYGWPLVGGLLIFGCALWAFQNWRKRHQLTGKPRR